VPGSLDERRLLPFGAALEPLVISFRFHLVSLVAVFLALGIGVVAGTTVLDRVIVAGLEAQQAELERQLEDFRLENERYRSDLAAFEDSVVPFVVDGRLSGARAVVVTQEGTEEAAIDGAVEALDAGGAEVVALLSVGRRMALPEEEDREALASIVGAEAITDPVTLKELAAEALARRVSLGPLQGDVLLELIRHEFLLNQGRGLGEQGLGDLADADIVVVVGGGMEQPALLPERFLVPLAASLAQNEDSQVVAAAESLSTAYEFVTLLRADQETAESLVTQDNVDQLVGEVGLVLGVEQLMELGEPGHYGSKDGATGLIPAPPPA
jgi:hypothetical protein